MAVRLNTIPPLFLRSLFIFVFSLAFCASASCLHSKASCSYRNTAEESQKNIPGLTLLHSSNPQCTSTHSISVFALSQTGNRSCGLVFAAPTHARRSFKRDLTHSNIWSSICVSMCKCIWHTRTVLVHTVHVKRAQLTDFSELFSVHHGCA